MELKRNIQTAITYLFNRNILILSGGTIISQAIVFLASPVISRLYHPQAFGYLSVFTSLSVILACLFTGKYELSIFAPKNKIASYNIIKGIFYLSTFFSLLTMAAILAFIHPIAGLLHIKNDNKFFLYLVPLSILQLAILSSFQLLLQRNEQYKRFSSSVIMQSSATTIIGILAGYAGYRSFGLIYGYLIGQLTGLVSNALLLGGIRFFRKFSDHTSFK